METISSETITISLEKYHHMLNQISELQEKVSVLSDRRKFIAQEYVDSWEACRALKICRRTLERYRNKNLIPCFRLNKKVFYRTIDLEYFLYKQSEMIENNPTFS